MLAQLLKRLILNWIPHLTRD